MKLMISTLVVCLLTASASAVPVVLIDELFNAGSGGLSSQTNPAWSDSDGGGFEVYGSGGAGPRGMLSTYDHDMNGGTPNINIPGGIEVNDDAGPVTLTASLVLPEVGDMAELNFFAGRRGSGGARTLLLTVQRNR